MQTLKSSTVDVGEIKQTPMPRTLSQLHVSFSVREH